MDRQAFINNAKAILICSTSIWTKNKVEHLLNRVLADKSLDEDEIHLFEYLLNRVFHPPQITIELNFYTLTDFMKSCLDTSSTFPSWSFIFVCELRNLLEKQDISYNKQYIFDVLYRRIVLKQKTLEDGLDDQILFEMANE
jgi:hypothetical protein